MSDNTELVKVLLNPAQQRYTLQNISSEKIAEALCYNDGNMNATARELGVGYGSLRKRIQDEPVLKELVQDIKDSFGDVAENTLHQIIRSIDPKNPNRQQIDLLKFYLSTKHKDRGYTSRSETRLSGSGKFQINLQLTNNDEDQTED